MDEAASDDTGNEEPGALASGTISLDAGTLPPQALDCPALDGAVVVDASVADGSLPLTGPKAKERLGELLFNDKNLSASRTEACSSCHEAARAFTGNNQRPELFPIAEGAFSNLLGTRNSPTAMYAAFAPAFGFVEDPDEPGQFTPVGGQFWDGRAADLAEQARGPFINPRELALPDKQAVIERVRAAEYRDLFTFVYGARALDDVDHAYELLSQAIASFEQTSVFSPFSSRFDSFLRGRVELSPLEDLGFELFKDPEKGNCIACHVGDVRSTDPADWLFTDHTYDNIGVPRNTQIPDNDSPEYYDLGLCQQPGLAEHIPAAVPDKEGLVASLCGAFKVPTLRNVARTAPYMHNGYFTDLRQVVDFYVTRSTQPERWYPARAGEVQLYDDLPAAYHDNVNVEEVPYDRKPGEQARLTSDEIDALVAFLNTLTDQL